MGDFDSAYEHAIAHLRLAQEINDKVSGFALEWLLLRLWHRKHAAVFDWLTTELLLFSSGCFLLFYIRNFLQECEARALYSIASLYHCRAKTIIRASEPLDESGLLTASDMTATSQLQAAINCYL